MSKTSTEARIPERLRQRTQCEIGEVAEDWDIEDLDYEDELREAIENARENHDETYLVDTEGIWVLEARWNDNTDSVWVGAFGYQGGFAVLDQEGEEYE